MPPGRSFESPVRILFAGLFSDVDEIPKCLAPGCSLLTCSAWDSKYHTLGPWNPAAMKSTKLPRTAVRRCSHFNRWQRAVLDLVYCYIRNQNFSKSFELLSTYNPASTSLWKNVVYFNGHRISTWRLNLKRNLKAGTDFWGLDRRCHFIIALVSMENGLWQNSFR